VGKLSEVDAVACPDADSLVEVSAAILLHVQVRTRYCLPCVRYIS